MYYYDDYRSIGRMMTKKSRSRLFGSYKESKLSGTQLSWAGQYKTCVQYNFKFTSEYSEVGSFSQGFSMKLHEDLLQLVDDMFFV